MARAVQVQFTIVGEDAEIADVSELHDDILQALGRSSEKTKNGLGRITAGNTESGLVLYVDPGKLQVTLLGS